MEAQCVSEIEDRGFADPNIRARCVDIITLLRKMKKSLEFYVENGHYAKEQLDALLEVKSKKLGGLFG